MSDYVRFEDLKQLIDEKRTALKAAEDAARKSFLEQFLRHFPLMSDMELQLYHAGLVDGLSWKKRTCIVCRGTGKVASVHPGDHEQCMQCSGTGIDVYN